MDGADTKARALLATIIHTDPYAVWLADVDDTLTDTVGMHEAASISILDVLEMFVGKTKASEIVNRFIAIFEILLTSHQSKPNCIGKARGTRKVEPELLARVDEYQQEIKQQWGATKKFSREILLRLAGEDCGILLTSEQIQQCADHYWHHVEVNPICFADAIRMSENLKRAGFPLFLFTSSDGRMALKENGYFHYDPESSLRFKARRMEGLRAKGLRYHEAFIGDPIDKPTPQFFDMVYRGIERGLDRQLSPTNVVVLGDSYGSDLEFPISKWNVRLGILYRRGQENPIMNSEKVMSVGTWDVVSELLTAHEGQY